MSRFVSVAIDLNLFKLADKEKCIKTWMSSNFGQIGQQATDLAAIGRIKLPIDIDL